MTIYKGIISCAFACWLIFRIFFLHPLTFFQKLNFFPKFSFRYNIWVSNNFDSDQDQHFAGLDLGQNCLQSLSADDKIHHKWPQVGKELKCWSGYSLEASQLRYLSNWEPWSDLIIKVHLDQLVFWIQLIRFYNVLYSANYSSLVQQKQREIPNMVQFKASYKTI